MKPVHLPVKNVPEALHEPLKWELDHMTYMGAIANVEEHIPATLAQSPRPTRRSEMFPSSDVLVKLDPTLAIAEPLSRLMTLPSPKTEITKSPEMTMVPQKTEVPAYESAPRRRIHMWKVPKRY